MAKSKVISVDNFVQVIDRMKVPNLDKQDVIFLALKYIGTLPNMIQYENFLSDLKFISSKSFFNIANYKDISNYIRKAALVYHNITDMTLYFKRYIVLFKQENMLSI